MLPVKRNATIFLPMSKNSIFLSFSTSCIKDQNKYLEMQQKEITGMVFVSLYFFVLSKDI